ncbi:transglutaminase-like domain-containing protein [Luteimonas panaciterrae]|uniref:transglutaminase-like domain-containing protein n=1 Tax=Luteimonas panaciterrae TaxID=363885 RepID=UPI001CFBD837|nr:transglutaminase-like domain-containing protein [Luteimonas panaciterrae]
MIPRTAAALLAASTLGCCMAVHGATAPALAAPGIADPISVTTTEPLAVPADIVPISVPSPQQIIVIPPELRAQLRQNVINKSYSRERRMKLLVDYIFSKQGLGLEYDSSVTRTIEQTFRDRKGNCMSFTLLFVTLAREAGVSAYVQEVGQALSWYQEENTLYNAGHVNVGIQLGTDQGTVDLDRNILLARGGPKRISDKRALAHFYNNRGSELMQDGYIVAAKAHFDAALAQDPGFAPAWNNLGVLRMRNHQPGLAERDYLAALQRDASYAPALSNMVNLYRFTGDEAKVDTYMHRLRRAQLGDPFYQFLQADQAEKRGDYAVAATHYRRAIRLYDKVHQFHFGLARVYFLSGDMERARRELSRALALSSEDAVMRNRYQAKMDSLRRWSKASALAH